VFFWVLIFVMLLFKYILVKHFFMKQVIKPDHLFKDQLLQIMIDNEWSDMYLTVNSFPAVKIWWDIVRIDDGVEIMTWKDTFEFTQSIITEDQHDVLIKDKNLDFSFSFSDRRFRCNISFQLGNYMIVLRLLTGDIPNIDDLWLT